jgi:hypothetical protein
MAMAYSLVFMQSRWWLVLAAPFAVIGAVGLFVELVFPWRAH